MTVPPGELVIVAPEDSAFTSLLAELSAAGIDYSALVANQSMVVGLLAEHVAVASSTAATTATTLSGNTLTFVTNGVAGSIETLVQAGKGSIVDGGSLTAPNVNAAIQCTGFVLFSVDSVLVPKQYASALKPASAPAVAPSPAPAPKSSAAAVGLSAVAALAAIVLA